MERLKEMNEAIIKNHNERVKPNDWWFHIGDFLFYNTSGGKFGEGIPIKPDDILNRLNGRPILLCGSHDWNNRVRVPITSMVIHYGGHKIFLTHDPKDISQEYSINLVGHVHNKWKIKKIDETIAVNVGVDVWNFRPITINDILTIIAKWKKEENF